MATKRQREKSKERTSTARRRAEQHTGGGGSTTINKPEDMKWFEVKRAGTYRFDIIPFKAGKGNPYADEGELHYERTFYTHRGIGASEKSFICNKKTNGKKCYICEERCKP